MAFAADIAKWVSETEGKLEDVVRQTLLIAAQGVIQLSPVGDAKLWKHPAPPGYVGGQFRANWNFSIGGPDTGIAAAPDPSGAATLAAIQTALQTEVIGKVLYLTNSLPYAKRIEYEAWSSQAPAGVVRVTVADLERRVESYIASIR